MHKTVRRVLNKPLMMWNARTLLTLPFWLSGLSKLYAFDSGAAKMANAGLYPSVAFNVATIVVQLTGSVLVIVNRAAWLGALALGIFTGLTVLLVHRFWAISEEPLRTIAFHISAEHIGIIGGSLTVTILSINKDSLDGAYGGDRPARSHVSRINQP